MEPDVIPLILFFCCHFFFLFIIALSLRKLRVGGNIWSTGGQRGRYDMYGKAKLREGGRGRGRDRMGRGRGARCWCRSRSRCSASSAWSVKGFLLSTGRPREYFCREREKQRPYFCLSAAVCRNPSVSLLLISRSGILFPCPCIFFRETPFSCFYAYFHPWREISSSPFLLQDGSHQLVCSMCVVCVACYVMCLCPVCALS